MRPARSKRDWARGFSIIESLIAFALLTFAIMSMFGVLASTFGYTEQDSEHIQAVAASQQYLDALRQATQNATAIPTAPNVNVDPGFGQTGNQIIATQTFTMTNNGCPLVSAAKVMHNCTVTTTWTEAGASMSVTVQSYVSQQ